MPVSHKKGEIMQTLAETYPNRRSWIKKQKPSANEIFQKYPRLLDFNGEMVKSNHRITVFADSGYLNNQH